MRRKVAIRTLPEMPATVVTATTTTTTTNAGALTLLRRKVAKRTIPTMATIHITSPLLLPLPQDEDQDIPAKKKARLQVPLITTAPAETTTEANAASGDGSVAGLPAAAGIPTAATTDAGDASTTTASTTAQKSRCRRWTLQEDTTLTRAVQTDGSNNWTRIAALVPDRTKKQCSRRWYENLHSTSTDQTPGRTGTWTASEVEQLKDAVQTHGSNNLTRIAALVPDRTKTQCSGRWHNFLGSTSTDQTHGRTGKWTASEDAKLKDAMQRYGGKNWIAITALVPGRTKMQCSSRWHKILGSINTDQTPGRTGIRWTADEDAQLKDGYKGTVARIGIELLHWCLLVERKNSVRVDGINTCILASTGHLGIPIHGLPTKTIDECCGTKTRWQESNCNNRNGSRSNEYKVYESMARCLGSWCRLDAIALAHDEWLTRNVNTSAAARYLLPYNNGVIYHSGKRNEAKADSFRFSAKSLSLFIQFSFFIVKQLHMLPNIRYFRTYQ
jgi:hypothetical protein